jgi:predicted lysophospholipase L1 biosynthesis ABC-type transport system permease subunit
MSLELLVGALKGVARITQFIQDARAFFAEHKDAVDQLKSLGIAALDAKEAYVANRGLCLAMGQRVGLLSGATDLLGKHAQSAQASTQVRPMRCQWRAHGYGWGTLCRLCSKHY